MTPLSHQNSAMPIAERVADLIANMTIEEKISQFVHPAAGVEHLQVPPYNWWNECLHGVARAGVATVFPQAIGLAAMWNKNHLREIATVISDEARAKHHRALREGNHGQYFGLTFWTPNINIFRDPRWGRGQETYGEDPYLTATLGVIFIHGLQGDDPKHMKVAACAKHYAVHSGPENDRHTFNAVVTAKDLWETYLPAFEFAVREGHVEAVMPAYNRTNGEACVASETLLQQILRDQWGFEGHVVSDCWAIVDLTEGHKLVETPAEAAALAIKAGTDLNCGYTFEYLGEALAQNLITEADIDRALTRTLTTRFKLGMFDPEENVRYASIPFEVNDSMAHREKALQATRESMVLLKNADNVLPLDKNIGKIAVIGPNAHDVEVMVGNYNGTAAQPVTPLQGLRATIDHENVAYARGCFIAGDYDGGFQQALNVAQDADVIVFVGGLSQGIEGEEGEQAGGMPPGYVQEPDRADILLPKIQRQLIAKLHELGKPIILVLMNGSAIALGDTETRVTAILEAWYPGQAGGTAIADVLVGDYNPAGRLPVTFYRGVEDLPPFEDYNMTNRTYRYFTGEVLYPFGHGLSYTTFEYSNWACETPQLAADTALHDTVTVRATVKNTGDVAGDEVAQVYAIWHPTDSDLELPLRQLVAFERFHLPAGEGKQVTFTIRAHWLAAVNNEGERQMLPGEIELVVAGGQPLYVTSTTSGRITVTA